MERVSAWTEVEVMRMTFTCQECDHAIVMPVQMSDRDVLICPHCQTKYQQMDEIEVGWQSVTWREDQPTLH